VHSRRSLAAAGLTCSVTMLWLLSTQAVAATDAAYEHSGWQTYGDLNKSETEIQFDKDRYTLFKFPLEEFAINYAGPWTLISDNKWLVRFETQSADVLRQGHIALDTNSYNRPGH
jgi:hypothetical protein